MTTLRQIEANQRNAARSTGPCTPLGKEQSRRNALKHGLSGAGIVLPEDETEAVAERLEQWHSSLRPWNAYEEWVVEEIVVASIQIDRCQAQESLLRTELAERAGTSWDDDRRLAAEVLAVGLAKKPALISLQLQQTRQGCDWIFERWETLGRILETKGAWSDAQKALALDLLGTPPELRDGPTRLDPAPGEEIQPHRAALVAGEIQRLKAAQETVLIARDEREQLAAELGLDADAPRPLALVRRYLAACRRRFWQAFRLLRRGTSTRAKVDPTPAPPPPPPSNPAPPPFDARFLEESADEFNSDLDLDFDLDEPPMDELDPALLTDRNLLARLMPGLGLGVGRASAEPTPTPTPIPTPTAAPAPASPLASSSPTPSRPLVPTPLAIGNRRSRRARASQARRA
jgi:hypothetical protein